MILLASMPKVNGFCFCLFVLRCLQLTESSKPPLYTYENTVDTRERFSTNSQRFRSLDFINECLKGAIIKTESIDDIISQRDNKDYLQTQFDSRVGVKTPFLSCLALWNFRLTPNELFKSSVGKNENAHSSGGYPNFSGYDVDPGTVEVCLDDAQCSAESSYCTPPEEGNVYGTCECKPNYVNDGTTCVERDDVQFCSTHEDCGGIEKGRCTFYFTTKTKVCKCERNFVAAKHQCLPKVQYLGNCISAKQCSMNMQCINNICRHSCNAGYTWKHDTCIKDLPDIKPSNNRRDIIVWQIIAPVSIISGVSILALFITLAVILRRRILEVRNSINSDNQHDLGTESTTSQIDPMCDQPPSYDEIVVNPNLTLVRNAQDMAEDPPPSYKSWEERYSNEPDVKG